MDLKMGKAPSESKDDNYEDEEYSSRVYNMEKSQEEIQA